MDSSLNRQMQNEQYRNTPCGVASEPTFQTTFQKAVDRHKTVTGPIDRASLDPPNETNREFAHRQNGCRGSGRLATLVMRRWDPPDLHFCGPRESQSDVPLVPEIGVPILRCPILAKAAM